VTDGKTSEYRLSSSILRHGDHASILQTGSPLVRGRFAQKQTHVGLAMDQDAPVVDPEASAPVGGDSHDFRSHRPRPGDPRLVAEARRKSGADPATSGGGMTVDR